jgi:hypothetical protein
MPKIEGSWRFGSNYAGLLDGVVYSGLLCVGLQLRSWMPEVEVVG